MADLPGMPTTIRCHVCGFENTTTSLYCQDCGVRLVAPPSAVVAEEEASTSAASTPAPATTWKPKKPRILTAQREKHGPSLVTIIIRTLVVAALAALVIQIIRPPSGIPPVDAPLPDNIVANVRAALQTSAQRHGPFDAPWAGQGLNAYLAAVLRPGVASGVFQVAFQRAALAPIAGGFSLFTVRKVGGLDLYSRIDYRLVARSNGISITPTGAALGRLALPASAAPLIASMSGNLDQALASELGTLREAKSVRITPEKASIDFGSSQP